MTKKRRRDHVSCVRLPASPGIWRDFCSAFFRLGGKAGYRWKTRGVLGRGAILGANLDNAIQNDQRFSPPSGITCPADIFPCVIALHEMFRVARVAVGEWELALMIVSASSRPKMASRDIEVESPSCALPLVCAKRPRLLFSFKARREKRKGDSARARGQKRSSLAILLNVVCALAS